MIVKLAFHGLDVIQGLFAQLLLQVRVHVAGVNDKGGSLQKSGPCFGETRSTRSPVTMITWGFIHPPFC